MLSWPINDTFKHREFDSYSKMIAYTKKLIDEKLVNIQPTQSRQKRGLINAMGSIVKTITGNLDAADGERYNKILKHLEDNQHVIQNQLKLQYSVNNGVIHSFNNTIQNIQHNEIHLKTKILDLHRIAKSQLQHQDILFGKDLYNQLLILFNTVLDVIREIENSITFCKLGTYHPSIMKTNDLYVELQRISTHYKNQLPFELKLENILDFEKIMKVNCKIELNRIVYFLSIPIDYDKEFELFYLAPVPTKFKSTFVTIIPDVKYLLKSNDVLKPLSDICTYSKLYHCASRLQLNHEATCERQLLLSKNISHCQYTELSIKRNHIEIIPEINQYLAVFPHVEKIVIECPQETETKVLHGIYLLKADTCKIIFDNHQLLFQDETHGSPLIIDRLPLEFQNAKPPELRIELKTLKLEDVPNNPAVPIIDIPSDNETPNAWTIILYLALALIASYYAIKWLHRKKSTVVVINGNENNETRLPGDASF